MVDHIAIENQALDILDRFNITEPVVNAVKIAEEIGVKVEEINMPKEYSDVAGFYDQAKKTIYIAADDKPWRKLFSVAHELGHIFLGHERFDLLFRIPKKDSAYSEEERGANSFAAALLMPDFMLREKLEKYNLTRGDYQKMAEIFGVPAVSMKVMLEHLPS